MFCGKTFQMPTWCPLEVFLSSASAKYRFLSHLSQLDLEVLSKGTLFGLNNDDKIFRKYCKDLIYFLRGVSSKWPPYRGDSFWSTFIKRSQKELGLLYSVVLKLRLSCAQNKLYIPRRSLHSPVLSWPTASLNNKNCNIACSGSVPSSRSCKLCLCLPF